jgi:hypothetical protein
VIERVIAPTAVSLPVVRGQHLGRIDVFAQGKLLGTRPLVAGRSVARPGIAGRFSWYSTRTMHHLVGFLP